MALDIFGIPPTEADNEHLYSMAGDMVMKKRHRLSANIIGAVQCLRQWDEAKIIDWQHLYFLADGWSNVHRNEAAVSVRARRGAGNVECGSLPSKRGA
jgi:hypothetical protein